MHYVIKLFGYEAEQVGRSEVTIALVGGPPTCVSLRAKLVEQEPKLRPQLSACRFAVNHAFVPDDTTLSPDDEIALIGMVSGG